MEAHRPLGISCAAGLVLAMMSAATTLGQVQCRMTDFGTLPGCASMSADEINNCGQVFAIEGGSLSDPVGIDSRQLLFGVIVVAIILLLWFGRSRVRCGGHRLVKLCVLAIILGPLAGACFAGLWVMFGDVDPLDRPYGIANFITLGTFAGLLVAVLMGITGMIVRKEQERVCQHNREDTAESPSDSPIRRDVVDSFGRITLVMMAARF